MTENINFVQKVQKSSILEGIDNHVHVQAFITFLLFFKKKINHHFQNLSSPTSPKKWNMATLPVKQQVVVMVTAGV